jgi:ABC-type nitrate/sulfonate/bicarbonate transport system substrate-binding protein
MTMRHSTAALIVMAALLALLALNGPEPALAAQINIFSGSSPVFAPVFIADAKGFFKEEKLDVSVRPFTSGAEATEGFRSGAAQFLVASDVPALYLLPGGDVVWLAQFSANEDMLLIVGDKNVKGPADLKGKKIGLVRKSASEYLLHKYLKRGNLTLEDVKLVHLAPFDQVPALVRGDVDALSTWKPFDKKIAGLSGDKFRTISWNGQEQYILYSGIVAKRSFIAANQNDAMAVMRALRKASEWLARNDLRTVSEVLGGYLKTGPDDVAYVITKNSWTMVDDARFRGVMQDIERFLLAQNLIPKKVNWIEAKDVSFLRKMDPSLVKGE